MNIYKFSFVLFLPQPNAKYFSVYCLSTDDYKNVTQVCPISSFHTRFCSALQRSIIWLNVVSNFQRQPQPDGVAASTCKFFKLLSAAPRELEAEPTAASCLQRSIIYDFLSTSDDYLNVYFNIKYNIAAHYLIICLHVSFKLLPPWKSSFCPPPRDAYMYI